MAKPKKSSHKKPTQEELDAVIKEAEELKDTPVPTPEPEPEPTPEPKPEPELEPEPEPTPEPVEPSPSPSYKEGFKKTDKRYKESSREAQILHSKNKKLSQAIDESSQLPEPTEEELTKEFPDWEMMNDFERKMAKTALLNTRQLAIIHKTSREFKDIDAWNEKVDKYLDDPKNLTDNPDLEGKEEEFRTFAIKPTRRGVDFGDLIAAFLYQRKPTVSKGKMFPDGSGGPASKPKPKKMSIEAAIVLRKTDYKEYKRLLKAGKIETIE